MRNEAGAKRTGTARLAIACAFFLLWTTLAASALGATPAFADESSSSASARSASSSSASSKDLGIQLGNDYVWLGESCSLSDKTIDNDFLAAGRSIRMGDSKLGGSVRAAGQDVVLDDVEVTESVTLAGETASVQGGSANSVALAGEICGFAGESNDLHAYGEKVIVDGVVHGNATIAAKTVEIGPDAVIDGTLHVTTSAEPTIPKTAKIGKLDVTVEDNGSVSTEEVTGALASLSSFLFVFGIVMSILGTLVIAVLAEWLFGRHTAAAAAMIRTRTGATIGSGVVGALVAPIVIIILCCLVITLPVAGALTLALLAMTVVAEGFMGASVFKLAFPKLGRFPTALAGGAIMGVASAIPFLGALVSAAAFMYFLGYVLQTIFLSLRKPAPSTAMPQNPGQIPG